MITRNFLDQFKLTDWTPALLNVPNKFGYINESGLFREESTSQNNFTFEEITTTLGDIPDRIRGERNTVSRDATRQIRAYTIPHFPYDDYIVPQDIQGQSAYGGAGNGEAETLNAVMARKMDRIAKSHDLLLEKARTEIIVNGRFHAPNSTIVQAADIWAEWGVTRKTVDFLLGTGTTEPLAKCDEVVAHMLDNAQGETVSGVLGLCSPEFFNKLIFQTNVKEAFKFYSSTQEPLRNGGRTGLQLRRTFFYGGIEFVEIMDKLNGVRQIPAGEVHFVPQGTDIFSTTFAPAATFSDANTAGARRYVRSKVVEDVKVVLQSESNHLSFISRPAMVIKGFSSN